MYIKLFLCLCVFCLKFWKLMQVSPVALALQWANIALHLPLLLPTVLLHQHLLTGPLHHLLLFNQLLEHLMIVNPHQLSMLFFLLFYICFYVTELICKLS